MTFEVKTIWTCTTEGNNRGIETTVHRTEVDAIASVIRDLGERGEKLIASELSADKIAEIWDAECDGACIITPHNIEVEA